MTDVTALLARIDALLAPPRDPADKIAMYYGSMIEPLIRDCRFTLGEMQERLMAYDYALRKALESERELVRDLERARSIKDMDREGTP